VRSIHREHGAYTEQRKGVEGTWQIQGISMLNLPTQLAKRAFAEHGSAKHCWSDSTGPSVLLLPMIAWRYESGRKKSAHNNIITQTWGAAMAAA